MPTWYAVAHPGLEPIVAEELASVGLTPTVHPGGVSFVADVARGAELAMTLRTPDRLLLEVARGRAHTLDELLGVVRKGAWKPLLDPQATLEVHATAKGSRLHFSGSVEKKVTWGIQEALKGPRIVDGRPRPRIAQRVQVRIDADEVTLSIDAGGELLHRRGWRQDTAKAPLRENLAASLLRMCGWEGQEPLLDPFCGSGTIPIEAALLAAGRTPFTTRAFACSEWPAMLKHRRATPGKRTAAPVIIGADRDPGAIAAALDNAGRARVTVNWKRIDVAELEPPSATGLVLANPPWGLRVGGGEVQAILTRFGRTMRERFPAWRVVFLAPSRELAHLVDRGARPITTFSSGGQKIIVWDVRR